MTALIATSTAWASIGITVWVIVVREAGFGNSGGGGKVCDLAMLLVAALIGPLALVLYFIGRKRL